ncbi:MAG TPA: pyridoxal-phosphate dependent enzyme [Candidatus Brocadiia bacterium]|nr:pyridoxal-phosphate dependent enzyme [Candidatus Brocadiia bacterium]
MASLRLFEAYPKLEEKLPRVPLANLPTPVERLAALGDRLGLPSLYIKREDRINPVYAGNKVRPLEFVLGSARAKSVKRILTIGPMGSNSVACTATHARSLGIDCTAVLFPQPQASYITHNLAVDVAARADFAISASKYFVPLTAARAMLARLVKEGRLPFYVPAGAGLTVGYAGHVNAAFELRRQIDEGVLPEPDYLFLALGTCGTAAGLSLGVRAAGLRTKVFPVRITDLIVCNERITAKSANTTARLLHDLDSSFPLIQFRPAELNVLHDYVGNGYALPTPASREATRLLLETEGIELDSSYTSKSFSAMLDLKDKLDLAHKTVLFWYSRPALKFDVPSDLRERLPRACRKYVVLNQDETSAGRKEAGNVPPSSDSKVQRMSNKEDGGLLKKGDIAPDFEVVTVKGETVSLSRFKGGKYVCLVFLRYVGCPICQMTMVHHKREYDRLAAAGADVIIFAQSPNEKLRKTDAKKDFPFHLVGDPEREVYGLYGVGRGGLKHIILGSHVAVKATLKGYMHGALGGDEFQLPADFIVGPDGRIAMAHYGRHAGDNMAPAQLAELITKNLKSK